jgi:hypothetical protein
LIKHIVMWTVKGDTPAEKARNAALVSDCFQTLRGRVPGLLHLEVGIDSSRVDYACDVMLYTEFATQQDLDAYANNPEHLRVKREIGDVRTSRHQVDYEAKDPR